MPRSESMNIPISNAHIAQGFIKPPRGKLMNTYVADGTVYFVYNTFGEFIGPEISGGS